MFTALEHIPDSVKETINDRSTSNHLLMMSVFCYHVPSGFSRLARLETPGRVKAVLNKARKAVPTSHAGRLLEQIVTSHPEKSVDERNKELQVVDKTIELGVRELRRHQVLLTREQWLKEAERCESDGSLRTCEAIIKATVSM